MHIGFDISQTGAMKAGCGHFAHALIRAMLELAPQHRYSLFPSFGDFFFDVNMPERTPYSGRDLSCGPRHFTLDEARRFWTNDDLENLIGKPDIVHSNNFWCPTQLASSRLVFTLYDLSFVSNPEWTTETNRAACWEGVSRAAMKADWIVAISKASRAHYLEVFPQFPPDRVRVIYPCSRFSGASSAGAQPSVLANVAPGRFWLSVGTVEPRKNQRRIAEAYARYLQRGGAPMPLVFAGGHGWLMEDFRQHLLDLDVLPQVIVTGYVTDDELIWLYRNCHANIYFSQFEGFGLPVLEGMQFGAPTIASDSTSIPEVAGSAAVLIAPGDTDGLTREMLRIASSPDERARLTCEARERAALFDWKVSALALLALYEEAMSIPKRGNSVM